MSETRINIERIRQEHMTQVIDLLQHISPFHPPKDLYDDIWASFAAQNHVFAVVAVAKSTVVGYGSLVIEQKIRGGKMGHVEDIATSPNHRNKGIGKMLVDALYEIAREHNCYKVALQCQPHNNAFYEKCCYEVSGTAMQRFIGR